MNPVVEAMQILGVSEQSLFERSFKWYFGATVNADAAAQHHYAQYRETKQYPIWVLAFSQSVRRNGRMAA